MKVLSNMKVTARNRELETDEDGVYLNPKDAIRFFNNLQSKVSDFISVAEDLREMLDQIPDGDLSRSGDYGINRIESALNNIDIIRGEGKKIFKHLRNI